MTIAKYQRFHEGDRVIIHSLGPSYGNKEFRGVIRGIAVDNGPAVYANIWIIELTVQSQKELGWEYSCVTMPDGCVREDV